MTLFTEDSVKNVLKKKKKTITEWLKEQYLNKQLIHV